MTLHSLLWAEHPGTGRLCAILPPAPLAGAVPYLAGASKYVLVLASATEGTPLSAQQARRWVDAGASYVCCWGPDADSHEEAFDHAAFLPALGDPLPYTLMTTSHGNERFEEALWFAFWNTSLPADLHADLRLVVIQTDSSALADRAKAWVEADHG